MEKAYSRIKWENYPSIATPLNETNLNKMDMSIDEVDNRILGLDTAKLDKAVANTMVKDIAFNEKTGIFTITLLDGTTKTIDTKLEKVATNFSYNYETQKLSLTLADGTKQEIDMSTLISQYEFADTSTIGFTVGNEGKITAIVKDGSVTEDKLQPNFLADIKVEVAKGKSYSDSSYENATASLNASNEAKQYRDEAEVFRNQTQAMSGVEIATPEKAGLVKPDGTTITVDADGTIHSLGGQGTVDYTELENKPSINGTELNGNKTLNDLGIASATELAKTNTKVDTIIDKADLGIKETASGEEIHLTDSAEGKAVEFALYGKAEQNTTSGKNLLELRKTNVSSKGIDVTINGDGTFDASGTATGSTSISLVENASEISSLISEGGNFVMSLKNATYNGSSCNISCAYKDASGTNRNIIATGNVKNVDVGSVYSSCVLWVSEGVTVDLKNVGIQLEKGEVATPWENYSGGMASPNPQYPQPIEVSGASGSVAVKSCGKNLINLNECKAGGIDNTTGKETSGNQIISKDFCTMLPNTKYSLTHIEQYGVRIFFYDENKEHISNKIYAINDNGTFTTPLNVRFYKIKCGRTYTTVNEAVVQLELGNATPYEPYKETLATIPTENGLAGIKVSENGNYTDQNGQQWICDEVVKYADGSGEKIQRVGKVVFDGSEDEKWSTGGTSQDGKRRMSTEFLKNLVETAPKTPNASSVVINALCNISVVTRADTQGTYGANNGCSVVQSGTLYVYSDMYNTNDVSLWTSYLAENPMIVYYELAEPIRTPLTAEEIAEIEKLHTFYPVTNISNDADCGMRIDYVGEGIITTNTEIPIVEPKDEEELESGDNIVTLFGKIKKKLKNVGKGVVDVVDNLLSTSTDLPLSANQGRVLDEKITQTNESLADKESTLSGRINEVNENLTQKETDLHNEINTLSGRINEVNENLTQKETNLHNEINTLSENIDSQVNALDERITELSESATSGSLTSRTIMVQDFFETVPSTVNTAFGYHQASIWGNVVMVNMYLKGISGTTLIGTVKDEYKSKLPTSYIPVCVTSKNSDYMCTCAIKSDGSFSIVTNGAEITSSDTLFATGTYICKGKTE